jgi:hypothetical protein
MSKDWQTAVMMLCAAVVLGLAVFGMAQCEATRQRMMPEIIRAEHEAKSK